MSKNAFTLIELLVVISILGLLSSLVLLSLQGAKDQADIGKAQEFSHIVRVSLGADLVSEWKLDDNTLDSGGSGNDGTINGDPVQVDGIFGRALEFDGTGDYLHCGNPSSLQLTGDMTISFWVYPTNIAQHRENAIDKAYCGEFALTQETSGRLSYFHGPNGAETGGYMSRGWDNIFSNDEWIHIVLTRKIASQSIRLYRNGEDLGEGGAGWVSPSVSNEPVTIGDGYAGDGFHGIIDEVQIYDNTLTITEIKQLYVQGITRYL